MIQWEAGLGTRPILSSVTSAIFWDLGEAEELIPYLLVLFDLGSPPVSLHCVLDVSFLPVKLACKNADQPYCLVITRMQKTSAN